MSVEKYSFDRALNTIATAFPKQIFTHNSRNEQILRPFRFKNLLQYYSSPKSLHAGFDRAKQSPD
jgi:hypothetical protein